MDRRKFLESLLKTLIITGGSNFFTFEELKALEKNDKKPDIIWIQALSCNGCSTELLANSEVDFLEILKNFCNIIFHPMISVATGKELMKVLDEYKGDNLIFVLEGSIPNKLPHACLIGEKPITYYIDKIIPKANILIAAGTCASFNGITEMKGMYTGAISLSKYIKIKNYKKPLVNLPSCPMKPHHFLYTLFYYIKHNFIPPCDLEHRPKRFFSSLVHERCIYYNDYQEKIFAKHFGDRGCLFKLGCQGPVTKCDCVKSEAGYDKYSCIKNGHPCIGCSSENFPRTIMVKRSDDERKIEKYKSFDF